MTIHYEILNGKNFNTYSLDHFVRHQRVRECWRNFLQGEQIGKWYNGAAEDMVLIPNGYVGDPVSSQYIRTNLKEADRRIAMDIVNRFGQRRLKKCN